MQRLRADVDAEGGRRAYGLFPFVVIAILGQLMAIWFPGLMKPDYYWMSTCLLAVSLALAFFRGVLTTGALVPASIYVASVTLLMLSSGGPTSGLGALLLIPIVVVALYGEPWESVAVVGLVAASLFAVSFAGPETIAVTLRKVVLLGSIGIAIPISVHALRSRLTESNDRKTRLLHQAQAMSEAAHRLSSLMDPDDIAALGAELAAKIASPAAHSRRGVYLRIDGAFFDLVAQYDETGAVLETRWPLEEQVLLKETVESGQPVIAPLHEEIVGPTLYSALAEMGITHSAWVPVRPEGVLDGVIAVSSRGVPVTEECLDRCVALAHLLELALSNWAAHQKLEQQATADERRRIARELHDGLAHELAFIASKTRASVSPGTPVANIGELASAAGRALDEARRAIAVLSSNQPEPLHHGITQTAEDLAARFGMEVVLDLDDSVNVPGVVRENVLRIVREAMTNSACHGNSKHIVVRLGTYDQRTWLSIEDDGSGFDPKAVDPASGFGLLSMQERAASFGGAFHLHSSPSLGTCIEVEIP